MARLATGWSGAPAFPEGRMAERESRVEAALLALERYRSRARDGGDGDGIECLIRRAHVAEDEAARHRRRAELIERAVKEGMDRELAAEVYDIAREEGIEPAFAFELVRCGVAVRDMGEPPEATYSLRGFPSWLEAPPEPEEEASRERMLRTSFRRLRHLLETHDSPEEALIAFAREPDVGEVEYE